MKTGKGPALPIVGVGCSSAETLASHDRQRSAASTALGIFGSSGSGTWSVRLVVAWTPCWVLKEQACLPPGGVGSVLDGSSAS